MPERLKVAASSEPMLDRRSLLGVVALSSVAAGATIGGPHTDTIRGTLPWQDGDADAPVAPSGRFLTAAELAFVTAAADRIIPPDNTGPSASQAGVPDFIDRQLAGDYGRGDHLYLGGPWPRGMPSQGFQSRFAPAQYYRAAIADIEAAVGNIYDGKAFKDLTPADQDDVLSRLESGFMTLPHVEPKTFFGMLLQNVKEGFFSDPIYGGNRNMAGWKMVGFPGARYDYTDWVSRHGEKVTLAPVGLTGRPGWRNA